MGVKLSDSVLQNTSHWCWPQSRQPEVELGRRRLPHVNSAVCEDHYERGRARRRWRNKLEFHTRSLCAAALNHDKWKNEWNNIAFKDKKLIEQKQCK